MIDNEKNPVNVSEEAEKETSDFADEIKPSVSEEAAPAPVEEKKPVERPAPKPEPKDVKYHYDDPRLQGIEASRNSFNKLYKKQNVIKWVSTVVVLAIVFVGWIVPTTYIKDENNKNLGLYISLGILAVALVLFGVFSYFFKKKLDVSIKAYFKTFYDLTDDYIFDGYGVSAVTGTIDTKLNPADFNEAGLYSDVFKVGSRASLEFIRNGRKIGIADAAAQVKDKKALRTVFVGKFLRSPNNYRGNTLFVYLKGNDRALPPTALDKLPVLIDNDKMIVRGENGAKKAFTHRVKVALDKIVTNSLLVDLSLVIAEGKTFVAMGYEDTLMVLPMEKPFNPKPTEDFKKDLGQVFALIDAVSGVGSTNASKEDEPEDIPEPVVAAIAAVAPLGDSEVQADEKKPVDEKSEDKAATPVEPETKDEPTKEDK